MEGWVGLTLSHISFSLFISFQCSTKLPSTSARPSSKRLYSSLASPPTFLHRPHHFPSFLVERFCSFLCMHISLSYTSLLSLSPHFERHFFSHTSTVSVLVSSSSILSIFFSHSSARKLNTTDISSRHRTQCVSVTFLLCPTLDISVYHLSRSLTLPSSSTHCWNPSHYLLISHCLRVWQVECCRGMIGVTIHCLIHCLFCIMRTAPSSDEFCGAFR